MPKKQENIPKEPVRQTLTRRQILAGAASVAVVASAPVALASHLGRRQRPTRALRSAPVSLQVRRFMAASATLQDGRILITGGYDQPCTSGATPRALNSALIYDPATGALFVAAPMTIPRARHTATTLEDGRIAVVGGMGMRPTASVELYDPQTNTWRTGPSLTQPRYDHTAAACGTSVCVLGGSSQALLAGIETLELASKTPF